MPNRAENLSAAERLIQALIQHADHMVHNRCGVVLKDAASVAGVRWVPVATFGDQVYQYVKDGKKDRKVLLGTLEKDGKVRHAGREVGEHRKPGIFPEMAAWLYAQAAEIWRLDNELAARWASWSFSREHRDLKVVLAALMLVQSRAGEPVVEDGQVLFLDEDYREVGEAMCLVRRRDGKDLNPRLLLRVGELLELPAVALINRQLGFGRSARNAALGRYTKAVTRWLRHRERNPAMLQGLVKAGYRTTVMSLARKVGYKPLSPQFFEILGWKQKQATDGRRQLALGVEFSKPAGWSGLSEREICERIVAERPAYKRLAGMIPAEIGLTRAILAAAVQAGSISDSELIILTPTLEELGLLEIPAIGDRWLEASEKAENQRAANIARRVKGSALAEKLQETADKALQREMAGAANGLKVYCAVDISASMQACIEKAKVYLGRFLQGFPLDKLVVCAFNTAARQVFIRHPSSKGVEHAFAGFNAAGGTSYGSAFREVFKHHPPAPGEDALCLFIGDQQQAGTFAAAVEESKISPVAFGLLYVPGNMDTRQKIVEDTAEKLNIPCFKLSEDMFGDAYAISRTFRHLIAATPVHQSAARKGLVEEILQTTLLKRPLWAA